MWLVPTLLDGSARLLVPLAQRELAEAVNVAPETASRLLACLERDGLIRRRGHRVTVVGATLIASRDELD